MRLIDADALMEFITEQAETPTDEIIASVCRGAVLSMPAVEAEPVRHGRWIMTVYTTRSKKGRIISNKKFKCSECGYGNGRKQSNYCPNCGAKMDGGMDDEGE